MPVSKSTEATRRSGNCTTGTGVLVGVVVALGVGVGVPVGRGVPVGVAVGISVGVLVGVGVGVMTGGATPPPDAVLDDVEEGLLPPPEKKSPNPKRFSRKAPHPIPPTSISASPAEISGCTFLLGFCGGCDGKA